MSRADHDNSIADSQLYAGFPRGMNNILRDVELPADAARNAVNVDFLDSGKPRRRSGFSVLDSAPAHSLWSNGKFMLVYANDALNRLMDDDTLSVLRADVANRPVAYTEAGPDVYWANGVDSGRLIAGVDHPWGVEDPSDSPVLAASGSGVLPAGTYRAMVTFATASGQESGASIVSAPVEVSSGRLVVTLPQPSEAQVTSVRLYLTPPNGDKFYFVGSFDVGDTTVAYQVGVVYGREVPTMHMRRFLPCEWLEHWRGRIYGAVGSTLWCTEPFAYGLFKPAESFYLMPSPIRFTAGMKSGMFVVCDKTYWLAGTGPSDFTMDEVYPYSAARGSLSKFPESRDVLWFSDRGMVIGKDGGIVEPVQAVNVMPGAYNDGATVIRESNSLRHAVAVLRNPAGGSTLAARDWMDAEIVRAAGA